MTIENASNSLISPTPVPPAVSENEGEWTPISSGGLASESHDICVNGKDAFLNIQVSKVDAFKICEAHRSSLRSLRAQLKLSEERAAAWMSVACRGSLPVEKNREFHRELSRIRGEEISTSPPQINSEVASLRTELASALKVIKEKDNGLRFYANRKDWHEFEAHGQIGTTCDGESGMCFDKGEDEPYRVAEKALALKPTVLSEQKEKR